MKTINRYMRFVPFIQKIVLFVLMPVVAVLLALGGVFAQKITDASGLSGPDALFLTIFSMYLLYVVTVADIYFERGNFGGSFSSRSSDLEYMKTSPAGLAFYNDILKGSMLVRFLYAGGVTLLYWLVVLAVTPQPPMRVLASWMFACGSTFFSMQLGALFCRLVVAQHTSFAIGMFASYLSGSLLVVAGILTTEIDLARFLCGFATLALGALLAVLMVVIGKKKKEKEYHDV